MLTACSGHRYCKCCHCARVPLTAWRQNWKYPLPCHKTEGYGGQEDCSHCHLRFLSDSPRIAGYSTVQGPQKRSGSGPWIYIFRHRQSESLSDLSTVEPGLIPALMPPAEFSWHVLFKDASVERMITVTGKVFRTTLNVTVSLFLRCNFHRPASWVLLVKGTKIFLKDKLCDYN